MQVETYCKKTHEEALEEQRRVMETVETRAVSRTELCKSLGLDIQAERQSADSSLVGITAEMFFKQMTNYEQTIWRNFLTRQYQKSKGQWKKYKYDTIPVQALEEISFAHSLGVFGDIEIWTPERSTDPAAIGVVNLHGNLANRFLITRWGESLKPFEEIEKEVCSRVNFCYDANIQTLSLFPKLQGWVETHKKKTLLQYGASRVYYWGATSFINFRRRHCGQKMHKFVEARTTPYTQFWVCPSCLHAESKNYDPNYN